MSNINFYAVKSALERMSCPTHGKHPNVSFNGSRLHIEACCETFRAKIIKQSEIAIAEEVKKSIAESLKRSFR